MKHKLACSAKLSSSNNSKVREQYVETSRERTISRTALIAQLKQCAKGKDLQRGKLLHTYAAETGCHKNLFVATSLITMYSRCGSMQDAREVFESMLQHNVVSWSALILGYVENGQSSVALDVFNSMDCAPNGFTFVAAFKACTCLAAENKLDKKTCLQKGLAIHRQAREFGFDNDVFVANTLVDMYRKCGEISQARTVFDRMVHRDVISWSALILGYVENGESLNALDMFNSMDCAPNRVTFLAALKACSQETCLQKGLTIHKQARECGFDKDILVRNTLVDMYSKCGHMQMAREVFDKTVHKNVVSWTSLILGYVENGESFAALEVFNSMDCAPDRVTFVSAFKACAGLATDNKLDKETCIQKTVVVHKQTRECGFDKDMVVANALMETYKKCGSMVRARDVFDKMIHRDVISWTTLILGYVETGESLVALNVFNSMDSAPNSVTFVAALKACANLGALEIGQRIHDQLQGLGLELDKRIANSLVDFYGKCGNMVAAEEVFNRIPDKDIVSWNALIAGYSLLGQTSQVFSLVKRVQEVGLQMDNITMLLILTACNHAGMVEEGRNWFESMSKYGINPTVEHYTCMADMLGRANRLQEALSLVKNMPFKGDSHVWMTLLGACSKWSNVEVGRVAFHPLVREHAAGAYVLMRRIYARLGMREEVEQIETERKKMRVGKQLGKTWWYDGQERIWR